VVARFDTLANMLAYIPPCLAADILAVARRVGLCSFLSGILAIEGTRSFGLVLPRNEP